MKLGYTCGFPRARKNRGACHYGSTLISTRRVPHRLQHHLQERSRRAIGFADRLRRHWHRVQHFTRLRTRMDEFTILRDAALASSRRFEFLKGYPVTFMPTLVAAAVPGGPVERKTYETMKAEFLKRLEALMPLDGLYLPMHGAMFVEGIEDAEADWYRAARKVVGPDCLLSASYDLHGNISQRSSTQSTCCRRFAPLLTSTVKRRCAALPICCFIVFARRSPTLMWAPVPVLMPGERSGDGMAAGEAALGAVAGAQLGARRPRCQHARRLCLGGRTALHGSRGGDRHRPGRAAPDRDEIGAAVLGCAGPSSGWDRNLHSRRMRRARDGGEDATREILADSGDNPTGGGNGDQATVLESLLRRKARDVIVAGIADRPATEACYKAGVGARIPLSIGATLDPKASRPVKTEAVVKSLLAETNPARREAVVQIQGITLVLAAYRRPYHDIEDFTRFGFDSEVLQDRRGEVGLSFAGTGADCQPEPDGAFGRRDQPGHCPPSHESISKAELPVRRGPQFYSEGLRVGTAWI